MSGTCVPRPPYRTAAEIAKDIPPVPKRKWIDTWSAPLLVVFGPGILLALLIGVYILGERHGMAAGTCRDEIIIVKQETARCSHPSHDARNAWVGPGESGFLCTCRK